MRFAGILLLIAAVSVGIFAFHRSRQVANETSAVTHLKTLADTEFILLNEDGFYGTVDELIQSRFLDSKFASPISGYTYSVVPSQFNFLATASRRAASGNNDRLSTLWREVISLAEAARTSFKRWSD